MFLSLVHLRDLRCVLCSAVLATAGARSFIIDAQGEPVAFPQDEPPAQMLVQLHCPNGHVTELSVPDDVGAEESLQTPDEAPIGADAVLQ